MLPRQNGEMEFEMESEFESEYEGEFEGEEEGEEFLGTIARGIGRRGLCPARPRLSGRAPELYARR